MSLLPHKVGPSSQCMMNGLHGRDSGNHFVTSRRIKTSASGFESNHHSYQQTKVLQYTTDTRVYIPYSTEIMLTPAFE